MTVKSTSSHIVRSSLAGPLVNVRYSKDDAGSALLIHGVDGKKRGHASLRIAEKMSSVRTPIPAAEHVALSISDDNQKIGYVVIDIALPASEDMVGSVKKMMDQLPLIILSSAANEFERRARGLLETYPLPDPLADEHLALFAEEREARSNFLRTYSCYSSSEIADLSGSTNKNRAQQAHRWKHEGRVLGLSVDSGKEVYPAFQFDRRKPLKSIKALIERLSKYREPWDIAHWMVSSNDWLSGERPIDLLASKDQTQLERLNYAAEQEVASDVV
jgi:hypothetical protein